MSDEKYTEKIPKEISKKYADNYDSLFATLSKIESEAREKYLKNSHKPYKMIDKKEVNELSNIMFELTVAYGLTPQKVITATGVDYNTVVRIQSANPFVDSEDFVKVKHYVDKYYKDRI